MGKAVRPSDIAALRTEPLPPDDKRAALFFSRLGYSLSEAIADLVDNSLDAEARNVLVRLVRSDEKVLRVLICDDGKGMSEDKLLEAMRFGSRFEKTSHELGKYGVGLKTASLSQARTVTVLSVRGRSAIGRRWTSENIGRGWQCEVLDPQHVADFFRGLGAGVPKPGLPGTVVVWEQLEHLQTTKDSIEGALHRTIRDLTCDLGLRFHRFISAKKLALGIEVQLANEDSPRIRSKIEALDPFSYPETGREGYPKKLKVDLSGNLTVECHIWPAKSNEPGYKLGGGKVSARQGFYFYRNDRLIQAGSWNGCREDDSEPHLSLARVKVDLPPSMDGAFKLDVKKSKVEPPPEFARLVLNATAGKSSFKEYWSDAQLVYRKQKKIEKALFKFLPGRGFPAAARGSVKEALFAKGTGRGTKVGFVWDDLDPDEFFRVDREAGKLMLNEAYRSKVLGCRKASGTDAPLVKLLLLLLFQEEFDRRASSEKFREWARRINIAMIQTLKKSA